MLEPQISATDDPFTLDADNLIGDNYRISVKTCFGSIVMITLSQF